MAQTVKPIPDGCQGIIPYLSIKGADEAIAFYKKAFGAEEVCRMPGPDGKTVGHAELKIGGSLLFLGDECPSGMNPSPLTLGGSSVCLHLYVENVDAAFAKAVAAGAKADMPPANMFWGDRYAKLTDPYGHGWGLATHVEDVPPDEMARRAEAAWAEYAKKEPAAAAS